MEAELLRLYPDQSDQVEAFQRVFEQLKSLSPQPSGIVIRLTEIVDDEDEYVEVDGYYADGRVDEHTLNDALALDFTPWNQWLGMLMDDQAFGEFTELEIIAHCLYEMTFISFDQEEIQAELDDLKRTVEELEKMSPEERKSNTKSLEDFLGELNDGEKSD